ncbi:type IV pilin [Vibrio galatheae]|uniref:Type IV pilin n=1 Tax=Vibrio galatheae TaxID=579748 RepID=A0A0F4NTD1_9VIBR|nr:prepilin-type N-terminal cleavage/methylation domain-containing protein [Vibrio galatheae]KJY85341.1 type IV pilin [Vibrio galatheae]
MSNSVRGFTLLEVLIALLLIGIASLSLIKMQVYIEQRTDYAVKSVTALNLIEKRLEWLRTRGAKTANSTIPVADFASISDGSESALDMELSWEVTLPVPVIASSLKQISMTAKWRDRLREEHQITLNTMLSEHSEFASD